MAQRARAVRPDEAFEKVDGEVIAIVSEDALLNAVVTVAQMVNFAGGTMSLVVHRHPTGVPHEMVTVGALIQWQDRTDAKPQPEPSAPAQRLEAQIEEAGESLAEFASEQAAEEWREVTEAIAEGASVRVEAGTLSVDPEPEELEDALEREAVAVGAEAYATPDVHENLPRVERQEGVGSGALPFQKGGAAGAPAPDVDLKEIAHGSTSNPTGPATPGPKGDFMFDDGLAESSLEEEDVSSIPEQFRD